MGKSKVAVLLLWVLFLSCATATKLSPLEIEIETKLKLLNMPALKTIKSEDGDIIDCVDIYKQPAFQHPALKNHTIQTIPDFLVETQNSSRKEASKGKFVGRFQTWQKSGSCPSGTVPIRRILEEDLLRAASLDRFGQKPPALFNNSTIGFNPYFNPNDSKIYVPENRSAAYLVTMGYNYLGAEADINIWNPKVDLEDDFTTAQIWVKTGNGPDFESVEAGWTVNPLLFADTQTRLFAYWTKDSYKSTGCFDLTCSGFVQTSTDVVLGAPISPISSEYGEQYDLNVGLFWDRSGNWWLRVKKEVLVGYWPAELLGNLKHSGTLVEWGGQVFSSQVKKQSPHTKTGMGSGDFANGLWGNACFMKNVRIKDNSLSLKYPEFVDSVADEPYCYNSLNYMKGYGVEPVFYFGGPGQRPPYCP